MIERWIARSRDRGIGRWIARLPPPAPSAAFPSNQSVNLDDHIVRFGVNYQLPWNVLDGFFKR